MRSGAEQAFHSASVTAHLQSSRRLWPCREARTRGNWPLTRYDDPRVLSLGAAAMDPTPERDDAADVPPWEQPGAVRRDCESHRGEFLMHLATTSLVCAVLSCITWGIAGILAFALALSVWVVAGRDLRAMTAGTMDSAGLKDTRGARRRGLAAMLFCVFGWGVLGAALWIELSGAQPGMRLTVSLRPWCSAWS